MGELSSARGTASDRLQRILYLLPAAGTESGTSLRALSEALGVTRDVILSDIEEVTAREYYHRAGMGDDLRVTLEPDRVRVWTKGEFRRPPKLTAREKLALGMGLRVLAAERGEGARESLLDLARRLEEGLASVSDIEFAPRFAIEYASVESPDAGAESEDAGESGTPTATAIAGLRGLISDAARACRRIRFRYMKAGAEEAEVRELEPYVLVASTGRWYAIGRDPERDAIRAFRLDRMLEASAHEESFEPDPGFDLDAYLSGAYVYRAPAGAEPGKARVRYSPAIARWILERGEGEPDGHGAAVVEHEVGDAGWAVRHVLQYGGDAELLGPEDLRARVARASRNAERAHGTAHAESAPLPEC